MPKIHADGTVTDVNVVAVSGVLEERVSAVVATPVSVDSDRRAGAESPGTDGSQSSPTPKTKPASNGSESRPRARTTGNR